jgi:hypothetical protein
LRAVRKAALSVMAEMVPDLGEEFWRDGSWRLTVKDDTGLTLFMLDICSTGAAMALPVAPSATQS